ncbi:uncharacterized protein LOC118903885 [Balaenoptera musculus]|uniref:Uncharacterized protein LOC118903885 n=1 Tax=Balaenoptera musculus TaxID=9771 RepID=A0A8B8YS31_BALMU|nr:uncharacterized protein LOC118903885 [Balaenoptera musculus]
MCAHTLTTPGLLVLPGSLVLLGTASILGWSAAPPPCLRSRPGTRAPPAAGPPCRPLPLRCAPPVVTLCTHLSRHLVKGASTTPWMESDALSCACLPHGFKNISVAFCFCGKHTRAFSLSRLSPSPGCSLQESRVRAAPVHEVLPKRPKALAPFFLGARGLFTSRSSLWRCGRRLQRLVWMEVGFKKKREETYVVQWKEGGRSLGAAPGSLQVWEREWARVSGGAQPRERQREGGVGRRGHSSSLGAGGDEGSGGQPAPQVALPLPGVCSGCFVLLLKEGHPRQGQRLGITWVPEHRAPRLRHC